LKEASEKPEGVQRNIAYLGRNDEVILLPAKLLNGLSEHNFRLSTGVDLGCVEEVDTGIVGCL